MVAHLTWHTLGKTEGKGAPIRHRAILFYVLDQRQALKAMAEIVSWNPGGHLSKFFLVRLGFQEERFALFVMFAGARFRKHLITEMRKINPKVMHESRDFRIQLEAPHQPRILKLRHFPKVSKAQMRALVIQAKAQQTKASWPSVGPSRTKLIDTLTFFEKYVGGME